MKTAKRFTLSAVVLASVLALAGPATADTTVSAKVGPIPLPNVPVQICVNQSDVPVGDCVTTPPAQAVNLEVVVNVKTPNPVLVPPSVTPVPCPAGTQGVAAKVFTGSAAATVGGSVTVIVNGAPVAIPVDQVVAPAGQTVTVFACAGLSPGV